MRLVMASVIRQTFTDSLEIFLVGGCIFEYIYSLLTMSLYLYGLVDKKVPYYPLCQEIMKSGSLSIPWSGGGRIILQFYEYV